MQRRDLLLGAGAMLAGSRLAAPGLARAQGSKVLRFVPQADLPNLDAVAGTQLVVRNASLLVFDMLYGIGADLSPSRRCARGMRSRPTARPGPSRLRPGLKFHDGEPVLRRRRRGQHPALDAARRHGPDDPGLAGRAGGPSTTAASASA
jgi:peptide/nickel transport system substrate-binding protein